jgi:glutamate dehydrogenase (NAD(P)+)
VRALWQHIGIDRDVPAPDVYTNPQTMAWMMDEYETITNQHHPGVMSNKPLSLGGSEGRRDATARGGVIVVREACKIFGVDPTGDYAIQGFGSTGQRAALFHQELLGGGKLVAASDSSGAVYNKDGINPRELLSHKLRTGSVVGFSEAQPIDPDEFCIRRHSKTQLISEMPNASRHASFANWRMDPQLHRRTKSCLRKGHM